MSEQLDEDDPLYAFKKWGRDYRTKDEYWNWRHARTDQENEKRAADKNHQPATPAQKLAAWRGMGEW